jgi:hypothetical protein
MIPQVCVHSLSLPQPSRAWGAQWVPRLWMMTASPRAPLASLPASSLDRPQVCSALCVQERLHQPGTRWVWLTVGTCGTMGWPPSGCPFAVHAGSATGQIPHGAKSYVVSMVAAVVMCPTVLDDKHCCAVRYRSNCTNFPLTPATPAPPAIRRFRSPSCPAPRPSSWELGPDMPLSACCSLCAPRRAVDAN